MERVDKLTVDYETRYKELSLEFERLLRKYLDKLGELDNQKLAIGKDINSLKSALKFEQKYLYEVDKERKEARRRKYLDNRSEVGEKVLKMYYDAFEAYYQKKFPEAIESLNKAIVLDPYFPALYIRLGSIFYELGMNQEALENWNKAIELDPFNTELLQLKEEVEDLIKTKNNT